MHANLPQKLRLRLDSLAGRIRCVRLTQGICRLLLVLAIAAFAAIVADACLGFPRYVRGLFLLVWFGIGYVQFRRWVLDPLMQPIDPAEVASAIEAEFPRLDERLATAVEVSTHPETAHGSPEFIAALIDDTEQRTHRLDMTSAVPITSVRWFAVASVVVLLSMLIPVIVHPRGSEFLRRFAMPWQSITTEAPFTIHVSSGDATVKRGDAVTLAAWLEPATETTLLPKAVRLRIRSGDGRVESLTMQSDQPNVWHLKRPAVTADFEYSIEAAPVESAWYRVAAVDAPSLKSVLIHITPPAYAVTAAESEDGGGLIDGLAELNVLEYSTLSYAFRFDMTPTSAWLEWKEDGADEPRQLTLKINPDGNATQSLLVRKSGSMKLVLERAPGIRSEIAPQPIIVRPDTPPEFLRVTGLNEMKREVQPSEKVRITCEVRDDFKVDSLQLEYVIGQADPIRVPLLLRGKPGALVEADLVLDLASKTKEGDVVRLRLVATDNRSVPEMKAGPQSTFYPAGDGWTELVIKALAAPLGEQEIIAKKEQIDDKLRKIIDELVRASRLAYRLRAEAATGLAWRNKQADDLADLTGRIKENAAALKELATDTALTPELTGLAQIIRGVAEKELTDTESSLNKVVSEPGDRTRHLTRAEGEITAAIQKLEDARKENERLARNRQEMQKLRDLAERQKEAAEAAKEADPAKAKELQARQQQLLDELKKLEETSEPIRDAIRKLQAEEVQQLGKEAGDLSRQVRDLDSAMRQTEQQRKREQFAEIVKRQKELSERLKNFSEKTSPAARAAQARQLENQEAEKAATDLDQGEIDAAMLRMAKAENDLNRWSAELERAVAQARDPKEAAKQLARLQEDLRNRVTELKKSSIPEADRLKKQEALQLEQSAIARAIGKLSLPEEAALERQRKDAISKAEAAAEALKASNPLARLEESQQALNRLAEAMPTRETRLARSKSELARLRRQQDLLSKQAENVLRPYEKKSPEEARKELPAKLADTAKKLDELSKDLAKIDLPGQEPRRQQVEETIREAAKDLSEGRSLDIPASQQKLARELERLEQAISGQNPADAEVDRLAMKQNEIAEKAEELAKSKTPDKTAQRELAQAQLDLALPPLSRLPESPQLHSEAVEAMKKSESALRTSTELTEAAKKAREAAEALEKLRRRTSGEENDQERVDRLMKKQKELAKQAEKPQSPDSLQELRKAQNALTEEAKQIPSGDKATAEKQKVLDSLNQTAKAPAGDLVRSANQSAEALKKLSEKLGEDPDRLTRKKPEPQKALTPELPNAEQVREARQLAQEQRQLREEMARTREAAQKTPPPKENPLAELVKEQAEIAEKSKELAEETRRQSGPQASETRTSEETASATKQAAERLRNGEVPPAKEAGKVSARKLKQMAEATPTSDRGKQSAELAKRQEEVNRKLESLGEKAEDAQAQQMARQQQLKEETQKLKKEFQHSFDEMKSQSKEPDPSADKAAQEAMKAEKSLAQAEKQAMEGKSEEASKERQSAAEALESAAKQAAEMKPGGTGEGGKSLQEAKREMQQAEMKLGQGQPKEGSAAMQSAAKALQEAAKQLGKEGSGGQSAATAGNPGKNDGASTGLPDLKEFGPEAAKFNGKSWGELPGELKTRIIQDMKARYGEDYARNIRLYFEQLADRK